MEEQIKSEQDTNINEKVTKKSISSFSLIAIATVVGIVGAIAILVFFVWEEIDKYTITSISQEQEEVVKNEGEYINNEFNFSFNYSTSGEQEAYIKEEGNKTTLCLVNNDYCTQFVEVFYKDETQTLTQAIEEDFLADYSADNCWVKTLKKEGTVEKAIIDYPENDDPNEPYWANMKNCPEDYSKANGIRYFYYDSNFPDRYAYFDIGQYSITDDSGEPWQDTFQFLDGDNLYKPPLSNNKYEYEGVKLSYEYKDGKLLGYNLFIDKDGERKLLADDILFDAPGGSVPKFFETEESNIVLLKASMRDMGGFKNQYYYIDLYAGDFVRIVETQAGLKVNNIDLTLNIEDNCPDREGKINYDGGIAYLTEILVHQWWSKYIYSPKVALTCVDPGGIGNIYEPQPRIEFKKLSTDKTRAYFSVLEQDFYYDIDDYMINQLEYDNNSVYIIDGIVYYKDGVGNETIVAESVRDSGDELKNFSYKEAKLSPNSKYILLVRGGYEWINTELYNIESKKIYEVDESGLITIWLSDNRIRIEGECGMGISCGIFESKNSTEPWILEKVADYES